MAVQKGNSGIVKVDSTTVAQVTSFSVTEEADMLQYGQDSLSSGVITPPEGRGTGNNIPLVTRIGLSQTDGSSFDASKGLKRPSGWGWTNAEQWLTSDIIIGGANRGTGANNNAVKGAFMFRDFIDCGFGEYLTAFVHIGHGSGNNGANIPRYDIWIRYNHNVSGYGGSDEEFADPCNDGSPPNSMPYAGGAHATAFKSGSDGSQDERYKFGSQMRAGITSLVKYESGTGKDLTGILPFGNLGAWYFDNIYFPYKEPVRQGDGTNEPDDDPSDPYYFCCNPDLDTTPGKVLYNSNDCQWYRNNGSCQGSTGPGFGGGCVALESYIPEVTGRHSSINQAFRLRAGTSLQLGTEDLDIVEGTVVENATDIQPCVRVTTSQGVTLVCSTTAPIYAQDGEYHNAPDLLGKYVAVMVDGETSFDEVTDIEPMGDMFVAVIDTGDNNFWAGEQPGRYMMHHNMSILGGANEELDKNKQ